MAFLDKIRHFNGELLNPHQWNSEWYDTLHKRFIVGDPLSPLLFVMAIRGLTQIILKVQEQALFKGFNVLKDNKEVAVLQYIDDMIIMINDSVEATKNLKAIITWFRVNNRCMEV